MSKGIIFYTDNELPPKIAEEVQRRIKTIAVERNIPIVTAALRKKLKFGDYNIYFPTLKRGWFSLYRQILSALEHSSADQIFFCEADILYHPSHFDFDLPSREAYYYNINNWLVWMHEGVATRVDVSMPLSVFCGDRELMIGHYQRKIAKVLERQKQLLAQTGLNDINLLDRQGVSRNMSVEPGGELGSEKVDNYPIRLWSSAWPNLDLRHDVDHMSKGKRYPTDYHNRRWAKGWTEAKEIPGWGKVSEIVHNLI
jgi:hypothetical protein